MEKCIFISVVLHCKDISNDFIYKLKSGDYLWSVIAVASGGSVGD